VEKLILNRKLKKRIWGFAQERKIPMQEAIEILLKAGLDLYKQTDLISPNPLVENGKALKNKEHDEATKVFDKIEF
jgi:hypothetical protein